MSQQSILCRDRVWPRQRILVATEYFLVTTEFGAKAKRIYVATENLMSQHSCLKFVSRRSISYIAIESSKS